MFKFERLHPWGVRIFHENGVMCGDLLMKDDGFYDWWPPHPSSGGCWPSHAIREIADKLDELNAPIEKDMDSYFSGQRDWVYELQST